MNAEEENNYRHCPDDASGKAPAPGSDKGRSLNQLTTLANMGRLTVLRGDDLLQECTKLCDTLNTLVQEVY